MEGMINYVKVLIALIGGLFSYLLGVPDELFWTLVTLIFLDIFTGIIKATITKKLNSSKMYKGMCKKVGTFVIIAIGVVLDRLFHTDGAMRSIVITFYIITEILSITENWGRMGLPLPKKLKQILEQLQDKEEINK